MTTFEIILLILIVITTIIFNLQISNIWKFFKNQIELNKSFIKTLKMLNENIEILGNIKAIENEDEQ